MFKTNFYRHNKIWGALSPNAPPWLRVCCFQVTHFIP